MKKLFLALILLFCLMPTKAQATVASGISCEARSLLRDGTPLIYTISGSVEFSEDERILSLLSRKDANLFITILRRERSGREKLLRSQERLGNFPSAHLMQTTLYSLLVEILSHLLKADSTTFAPQIMAFIFA